MKIQVVGSGCDRCGRIYDLTVKAVEALGCDAEIERVEDLLTIVQMGIMDAPALVIDGEIVASGRVPSGKAIQKMIRKHM